jgi:hypothetical protein
MKIKRKKFMIFRVGMIKYNKNWINHNLDSIIDDNQNNNDINCIIYDHIDDNDGTKNCAK